MLARHGIASTISLGLARDSDHKALKAHAWLSVAGQRLPGWESPEGFVPIAEYSDEG
jgi:hypothetical protein